LKKKNYLLLIEILLQKSEREREKEIRKTGTKTNFPKALDFGWLLDFALKRLDIKIYRAVFFQFETVTFCFHS
jgi:hypothetical protein